MSQDTKGILIPPKNLGTNIIFNPYQTSFDYMHCRKINNGKLSFRTDNTRLFQIKINSHVFGRHHTKIQKVFFFNYFLKGFANLDQNLTPLFLYQCLQVKFF